MPLGIIRMGLALFMVCSVFGQQTKHLVYDTYHNHYDLSQDYKKLLPKSTEATIVINTKAITDSTLRDKYGVILLFPKTALKISEKEALLKFLSSGGSLLLVFDEEKRTPFNNINDIISPFGIKLSKEDIPYTHNCGAIAQKNDVNSEKREIPYSGGRAVIGGKIISKVFMEGDYVHSAYVKLQEGGKVIVMADGMAALLMGTPTGKRLTGTKPSNTNYWGKDSRIFMKELLAFFLEE